MIERLSIEVIKRNDKDYRLIFKDGSFVFRKKFDSKLALIEYLLNIDVSNIIFA